MKNENVEDIFKSIDGMRRAEPSPFLYTRIAQRIEGEEAKILPAYVTGRKFWLAAASFAVLVGANFAGFAYYSAHNTTQEPGGVSAIVQEYQLIEKTF